MLEKINKEAIEMLIARNYKNPDEFEWDDNGVTFEHEGRQERDLFLDNMNLTMQMSALMDENKELMIRLRQTERNISHIVHSLMGE